MSSYLRLLLNDPEVGQRLSEHGRGTILKRHTCAHRVQELLSICRQVGLRETVRGRRIEHRETSSEGSNRIPLTSNLSSRT